MATSQVTHSPAEFAAFFGKERTWAYRQLYAGKINAITEFGRLQIPLSEVDKLLATSTQYDPQPMPRTSRKKARLKKARRQLSAVEWQEALRQRRRLF